MMNVTLLSAVSLLLGRHESLSTSPGYTCEGPTPLFLRAPCVYLSLLPPDDNLNKLLSLTWPRLDSSWYKRRWMEGERSSSTEEGPQTQHDRSSFPADDNSTWRHIPQPVTRITTDVIEEAYHHALSIYETQRELEEIMMKERLHLQKDSASYSHQALNNEYKMTSKELSHTGHVIDYCTQRIADRFNLDKIQLNFDIQSFEAPKQCEEERIKLTREACSPEQPYRNQDGSCNNLPNQEKGASFTPFIRLVASDFGDGVKSLRRASDGNELPNARLVSTTVNLQPSGQPSCLNILHMSFGQFLEHDLTETPMSKGVNGSTIPCCREAGQDFRHPLHPQCAPIGITSPDAFYTPYGVTCMEFVRSLPADRCTLGPRQHLNQLNSYIDGESIYGNSLKETAELRTFQNGLLKTQLSRDGTELLSPNKNLSGCNVPELSAKGEFCFKAGDGRVNEQIMLVVVTAVWAREHNRLAKTLSKLNAHWNDERIFQEAKRILVGELQQVTYNEYLPPVISPRLMEAAGLNTGTDGHQTTDYNENIDPSITTEFATGAFRFGHTQVTDILMEVAKDGGTRSRDYSSVLFDPFPLYLPGTPERLTRGAMSQSAGKVRSGASKEVSGKLFRGMKQFGLDLLALNIQRGRDHGIPGYVRHRMACGLTPVKSFDDLTPDIEAKVLESLKKVYRKVEDIDLFVGALAEKHVSGGAVGPTFACILADQFVRAKIGDRYWFEYGDSPGAFTVGQLRELQQVSFSRILCDNVRELTQVQRWSMEVLSPFNPLVACESKCIPRLNLDLWKEEY